MLTPNRKPYKTKDGYLTILPYSTRHWIRFFTVCGREDWATADKVVDPVMRSEHIDELYGKIAELAVARTTDEWLVVLGEQDIPCERVSSMEDLMTDEHLAASRMFTEMTDERIGEVREIRSPFQVDGELGDNNTVAPGLGEHTSEVLLELGYSESDITALEDDGVVVSGCHQNLACRKVEV